MTPAEQMARELEDQADSRILASRDVLATRDLLTRAASMLREQESRLIALANHEEFMVQAQQEIADLTMSRDELRAFVKNRHEACGKCGTGYLVLKAEPGRTFRGTGGKQFAIPATMELLTCDMCNVRLLNCADIEALADAEEREP
jgi:hypothetical protein